MERGFAPRFILNATILKSQNKNGHQWLTLSDGKSSITAVIWSSTFKTIDYEPILDDGVLIVGKLNFWPTKASLCVQVLDVRPTISTVLRKYEIVKKKLENEGVINQSKNRQLPIYPKSIAVLTSFPSSALADIKRTATERWPLTNLIVIPIPVQGNVQKYIKNTLIKLAKCYKKFDIEAIILARGGGSREDLILFDNEELCREISRFPIPVVTGLGHEDDITVADLVADYRAATPTAAVFALLPSRDEEVAKCIQKRNRLDDYLSWSIDKFRQILEQRKIIFRENNILFKINQLKVKLSYRKKLLNVYSPQKIFSNSFLTLTSSSGKRIYSIKGISKHDKLTIDLFDGSIESIVESVKFKKRGLK